jgi:hypothetical protein
VSKPEYEVAPNEEVSAKEKPPAEER